MDSLVTIELTVLFGEVEKIYYIKSKDEETALSTIKNTLHGINMALSSPNDDKGTFYIEGNVIINLNKVSAVSAKVSAVSAECCHFSGDVNSSNIFYT